MFVVDRAGMLILAFALMLIAGSLLDMVITRIHERRKNQGKTLRKMLGGDKTK